MGQKVNPHGLRVGVIKDWDSKWYAEADFADCLIEDHEIRTFLKKRLFRSVSRVVSNDTECSLYIFSSDGIQYEACFLN